MVKDGGSSSSNESELDLRMPAALVRTALSSEQTLMSWMRTSLSMFTFGFSITQFFYFLEQGGDDISPGPRRLGLALVAAGLVMLVLAVFEHVSRMRQMKRSGLPEGTASVWPIGSAVVLLALGSMALLAIITNWHF